MLLMWKLIFLIAILSMLILLETYFDDSNGVLRGKTVLQNSVEKEDFFQNVTYL